MADQLQKLSIFGSVVDHSIVGISIADMRRPDHPLIYVNNAFVSLSGYPRELAVGYNCRFLQGPDTDLDEVQRIRDAVEAGEPYTGELINYRQDGTAFWNRFTLYPVGGGSSGRPDFYVANQVDVTSLKAQAGVPVKDLRALENELSFAQDALKEASRFGHALQLQLRQPADGPSIELEAFLKSEQQAHQSICALLGNIQAINERYAQRL
jgi:PAS domain S-box-containing protein